MLILLTSSDGQWGRMGALGLEEGDAGYRDVTYR